MYVLPQHFRTAGRCYRPLLSTGILTSFPFGVSKSFGIAARPDPSGFHFPRVAPSTRLLPHLPLQHRPTGCPNRRWSAPKARLTHDQSLFTWNPAPLRPSRTATTLLTIPTRALPPRVHASQAFADLLQKRSHDYLLLSPRSALQATPVRLAPHLHRRRNAFALTPARPPTNPGHELPLAHWVAKFRSMTCAPSIFGTGQFGR